MNVICMRDIRNVTSGELLTKQAMKKNIMYKNTYKLKLLLNKVTAVTEALVVSGNKFFVCLYQRSLPPVSSATF
jgi:hypothetical protein